MAALICIYVLEMLFCVCLNFPPFGDPFCVIISFLLQLKLKEVNDGRNCYDLLPTTYTQSYTFLYK